MRVLAICSYASPARGSEFSVGWGWLNAIAADHELWVICNDVARVEVETYLEQSATSNQPVFTFVPWSARFVGKAMWPVIRPFQHALWRRRALKRARELCAQYDIELCHYVNAVGFLDVVPMWKIGLPFVWGPVGGLSFVHRSMMKQVPLLAGAFYLLKNALRVAAIYLIPRPRLAAQRAAEIIAATVQTQNAIQRHWHRESTVIAEVGADDIDTSIQPSTRDDGEPLTIIWSGRMHAGKAPQLLLDAVAQLPESLEWELLMIGDGPDRKDLEQFARDNQIDSRCRFSGWLSHEAAMASLSKGHVFVTTSAYDLTSNVLVEAMSAGLPIICLSSQAAAEIVGEKCGVVVDVDQPDQIVAGLAHAIGALYNDEPARIGKARASLDTSQVFSWSAKREALRKIYAGAASVDSSI